MADFDREVHAILGLPFDALGSSEVVDRVREAAASRTRLFLSTPNLSFAIACLEDDAFRNSVINSDLCIPDGMPLVWVARLLRVPIRERVTGSGVFEALLNDRRQVISVYFFGGPDGAAEAAARRINAESAGMRCVGYQCPGFGSVEEMSGADRIDRINASGADFLVVALGARKGQAWIERNRSRLQTPIISHLGAVVNFAAGTVSRAPRWMQRSGLEWLWRIKEEPALWRRYWNDGKALLYLLATRVVPFALRQRRESLAGGEAAGVRVQVSHGPGRTEVRLGGACTRGNLSGIREVFRYATEGCGDILLDLGEVSHVDSGFVALVMLLAGDRSGKSARLEVAGARPPVRAVFAGLNAGFLLGPSAS